MPFLAIAVVYFHAYFLRVWEGIVGMVLAVVFTVGTIGYWLTIGLDEHPNELNNYLPARVYPLSLQFAIAALLLVITAALLLLSRRRWRARELGEIR